MLDVMKNSMQDRFAAADVIGNVFDVSRAADTGRDIEARDLDANAMAALEGIGRCHDLDFIDVDLAGNDRSLRRPGQRVPRTPWQGSSRIERAVRRLEPAARELALVQPGRDVALAFARGLHAHIGPYVLEYH